MDNNIYRLFFFLLIIYCLILAHLKYKYNFNWHKIFIIYFDNYLFLFKYFYRKKKSFICGKHHIFYIYAHVKQEKQEFRFLFPITGLGLVTTNFISLAWLKILQFFSHFIVS